MIDQRKLDAITRELTKDLISKGRLIEAGWLSLRHLAIPKDASDVQLGEMRMAFFAGAQHVFGSVMGSLDEGEEPTQADEDRLSSINAELNGFVEEMKLRTAREKGSG